MKYNFISYYNRKKLEFYLRKMPDIFSNTIINFINPLRKKYLKFTKHPKWITLFVTNYCSARCEHCFYSKELNNKIEELNFENLKKIFLSLKKPLNTIRITGGEPFLNKDLEKFIIFLDENKIAKKIAITSHGMIPKLDTRVNHILSNIKNSHFHIGISLDGLSETHDAFRKIKNGFSLAIKHLLDFKIFAKKNKNFTFSTTTSLIRKISLPDKEDKQELFELLNYLSKQIGIVNFGFDHVRSVQNDVFDVPKELLSDFGLPPKKNANLKIKHSREDDVQLSIEEIKSLNDNLKKSNFLKNDYLTMRRLEIEYEVLKNKKRVIDCLAGYVDCVIYPSLGVSVCESTKSFANLKDYSFDLIKLLNSTPAESTRKLTSKCSCTHPCHLSDSMAYDTNFLKEYFSSKRL